MRGDGTSSGDPNSTGDAGARWTPPRDVAAERAESPARRRVKLERRVSNAREVVGDERIALQGRIEVVTQARRFMIARADLFRIRDRSRMYHGRDQIVDMLGEALELGDDPRRAKIATAAAEMMDRAFGMRPADGAARFIKPPERAFYSRLILFLASGAAYRWPSHKVARRARLQPNTSTSGRIMLLFVLLAALGTGAALALDLDWRLWAGAVGVAAVGAPTISMAITSAWRRRYRKIGDLEAWPFLTFSEMDRARLAVSIIRNRPRILR